MGWVYKKGRLNTVQTAFVYAQDTVLVLMGSMRIRMGGAALGADGDDQGAVVHFVLANRVVAERSFVDDSDFPQAFHHRDDVYFAFFVRFGGERLRFAVVVGGGEVFFDKGVSRGSQYGTSQRFALVENLYGQQFADFSLIGVGQRDDFEVQADGAAEKGGIRFGLADGQQAFAEHLAVFAIGRARVGFHIALFPALRALAPERRTVAGAHPVAAFGQGFG